MKFYLGLHQPHDAEKIKLPVFVSVSRLINRRSKLDHDDWIMDSGGFSMISKHGHYTINEDDYVQCIKHHGPRLAFCQDWMCEPHILQKTGLTIYEHQMLTFKNYRSLVVKDNRVRPVLQGYDVGDYLKHARMYELYDTDMTQTFGVGSVCSRNGDSDTIKSILTIIKDSYPNIKLHGFGVKTTTLSIVAPLLESADSMAWSRRARHMKLCNPPCGLKNCANCLEFALLWRKQMLRGVA